MSIKSDADIKHYRSRTELTARDSFQRATFIKIKTLIEVALRQLEW